jgi:hypothetical protein
MNFEEITPEVLRKIWTKRAESTIQVSKEILNFSDSDDSYFKSPKEVPPTPIAFFEKNFIEIIYHSSDDLQGRWMRFVLYVYVAGGKIMYEKLSDGMFSAQVIWGT